MTPTQKHQIKNKLHKCRKTPTQRHFVSFGKSNVTKVVYSCWCGKYDLRHFPGKLELADLIGVNLPVYSPIN